MNCARSLALFSPLYLVCVHVKNSLLSSLVTKSKLKGMGVATITRLREVLHSIDLDVVSLANVSQ